MSKDSFPQNYFRSEIDKSVPDKNSLEKTAPRRRRFLVNFIKNLPPNARVLDAGCGTAKGLKMVMAYRPDIEAVGLDVSDVSRFVPDKAKFLIGSIEEADKLFAEDSFDAVICLHVMEHLLYPMKTMESFKKIIKNDGLLFIEVPNWARIINPFAYMFFWNDYTHVRLFTKQAMCRLMEDYSFEIKLLKTIMSSAIIEETETLANAKKIYRHKKMSPQDFIKKASRLIINRFINLFIRDLLIVIAKNQK